MCPSIRSGPAPRFPGSAQEAPDFRDTLSALRLAVKATEQLRDRRDAIVNDLVDLPLG